jgi:hypothetical protein
MTIKESKGIILQLRDRFRLKYFIETGTLHGKTAAWAAKHFEQVYTIEISKRHHDRAKRLNPKRNIQFILGNSGEELSRVLKELDGLALVWLDAHWSPDLKYARPPKAGECPLIDELKALNADGRPHIVLIDDAHLFTKGVEIAHPGVFTPNDWPDAKTVYRLLGNRSIEVKNNVIIALPK